MDSKFESLDIPQLKKALLDMEEARKGNMQALGIILRLLEVASLILSRQELCRRIVEILAQETGFENVSILLYDPDTDTLRLAAALGFDQIIGIESGNYNKDLAFERGQGIAWQVFDSHSPEFIEDSSKTFVPRLTETKNVPKSLACLPISSKGVLNLSSSRPRSFPNTLRRDLVIITQVIGHILQTSQVQEKLSASHFFLQDLVEAKNQESEARLPFEIIEAACKAAPLGICFLNRDGQITKANRSLCAMLRCSEEHPSTQGLSSLFTSPEVYLKIIEANSRGEFLRIARESVLRADGTTFPAEIYLHPVNGEEDRGTSSLLVIHDLSVHEEEAQRHLQEEKLKALGRMAAGIAHDFNNLLMAILGNVELMLLDLKGTSYEARLKNIEQSVSHGAERLKSLLSYIGSNLSGRDAEEQLCDVNQVIIETVELTKAKWKSEASARGIHISMDLHLGEIPAVNLPPSEMKDAITNLIFNAVDAMPRGGLIKISTYSLKDRVVIEFSDSGTGIDDEIKDRVFDPYFTTKGAGSAGLGLSTVYGIVSQAGGGVEIKSTPGGGTTFVLTLPAVGPSPSHEPPEPDGEEASKSKKRILAVDDEPQIIELLSVMLEEQGYKVVTCSNAQEALGRIESDSFDLVLTDLSMPGYSGMELAKRIGSISPATPVILLTGWSSDLDKEELRKNGIRAVINKPFKLAQLISVIERIIKKPEN